MSEPLTKQRLVDSLPPPLRTKVIDMLLSDVSTRKVAVFMTEHGYRITHNAIAEYKRYDLPKHLETARKLHKLQQVRTVDMEEPRSLASITNDVLGADPLISRIQKKYERYDQLTAEAVQDRDYTGFAAIDRSETQAIRLHAELTGRLVDRGPTMNVQMVFAGNPVETAPKQESLDNGDVIDIRAVTR